MTLPVSFEMDQRDLARVTRMLRGLGPASKIILGKAIVDNGKFTQRQAIRRVAKASGVAAKHVRRRKVVSVRFTRGGEMYPAPADGYTVVVKHKPMPMKDLRPRETKARGSGDNRRAGGVSYQTGSGRRTLRGAFIVDKLGGHVFIKRSGNSGKIKSTYGTSPGWEAQRSSSLARFATIERPDRIVTYVNRRLQRLTATGRA